MRQSLKTIDPKLLMTLSALRNIHKLSFSSTLEVFACIANTFLTRITNSVSLSIKLFNIGEVVIGQLSGVKCRSPVNDI